MNKSTEIREIATVNYLSKKLNCAEAVSRAVLEAGDCAPQVVDAVVASACGFGAGIGGAGCVCGALAGGVMAISVLANGDKQTIREQSRQLHAGFVEKHKVTCCRALGRGLAYGTPERKQYCAELVRDVAELAVKMTLDLR
ncbi:MAG: C-GCAxxG-C-C family protein [Bacillota bacterium]